MDGGLLQKQSKQVINMTMGTRMGSQTKTRGWGRGGGGGGGVGGECVCSVCVRGAKTPKCRKNKKKLRTENFDVL